MVQRKNANVLSSNEFGSRTSLNRRDVSPKEVRKEWRPAFCQLHGHRRFLRIDLRGDLHGRGFVRPHVGRNGRFYCFG